ncbi:MAG TPA: DUF3857 domain-containing protein [Candidatus Angelobacter sp.]
MPHLSRHARCLLSLLLGAIPFVSTAAQDTKNKPDHSGEAYIVEQSVDKMIFENDGTGAREKMARVRVQSDAGVQQFGLLTFAYQKAGETVEINYVRVRKPDGSVVVTPLDEAQDMPADVTREAPFYSDLHEKHLGVKGLSSGDVLEFQAHWKVTNPLAPGQFWMVFQFSSDEVVLEQKIQVSVPRERPVKFKSPLLSPVISDEGTRRVYTWTRSNAEPQAPRTADEVQLAALGRFPTYDIQLSSFQSWEEVGRWYDGLQRERVAPSAEIRSKAAELTRNAQDDAAKLQAIYRYVSTEFRYFGVGFGIGRYQPHYAAEVLSNQYGDCKDKHTLLASLLAAEGIAAYPALINSSRVVDPDVPSPAQFDHLITVVPRGKELLYLDATAEVAPFGYLSPRLREKPSLIVPPDKPATLQTTPADPPFPTLWVFKIDAKLDDTGTLEGKVEETIRGDMEVRLRQALRSLPRTQWKDLIQRISYSAGFAGDVSDVTASMPEATEIPLRITYTYKRKGYPDWENRRLSLPAPGVLAVPGGQDDKLPQSFWLGALGEFDFEARVALPKGYSPILPSKKDLLQDFLEYHATYALENEVLVGRYRIVVKKREVSGSGVSDYKTFAEKAMEDRNRYIPLSSALGSSSSAQTDSPLQAMMTVQQQVWELPASKNAPALQAEQDARAAIQQNSFPAALEALQRAVALDPTFARDWILLAQMRMALGEKDTAIDAFRKAVDCDRQQPLPYKMLAFALTSLGRRSEAIQVWQDLAKVEPENQDIPTNLGALLMAEKRYGDAVPYFESAVNSNPKRIVPLLGLATAYLQSGQDEKASAAFNSALQLAPGPLTKNDIAWELALANKRLDDALRYSQEAVHDEEEASRKVQLDKLALADLSHSDALGAYWDTLGWVHFRLGNLKQAEGYLYAAWMLRQQDLIGYHLAQVYEKQQRRPDAVRMYRLVVSQRPTRPDDQEAVVESQKSLARLGVAPVNVNSPVAPGLGQLSDDRTVRLPKLVAKRASAEFFVMFAPGPKVEDTKFISGADELRSAGRALSQVRFKVAFPESSSGRLVRRGILACFPLTGCSFVLLPTDAVTSVN